MVLRLDPRLPLLWRDASTLQFGLDEPAAVVEDVGYADELMIDALRLGTSAGTVRTLGERAGAGPERIEALLDRLRPALERSPAQEAARPRAVVVEGDGPTAARARELLRHAGAEVDPTADAPPPDLAVLIAGFALSPARSAHWLASDVPHLAVVFGDAGARVGPLVEPGRSGCLHCLDRHRMDADPDWPRLVIQVLEKPGPSETPLMSGYIAAVVAHTVLERLRTGSSPLRGRSVLHRDASGAVSATEHPPHSECGCRALPGTATVPGA